MLVPMSSTEYHDVQPATEPKLIFYVFLAMAKYMNLAKRKVPINKSDEGVLSSSSGTSATNDIPDLSKIKMVSIYH